MCVLLPIKYRMKDFQPIRNYILIHHYNFHTSYFSCWLFPKHRRREQKIPANHWQPCIHSQYVGARHASESNTYDKSLVHGVPVGEHQRDGSEHRLPLPLRGVGARLADPLFYRVHQGAGGHTRDLLTYISSVQRGGEVRGHDNRYRRGQVVCMSSGGFNTQCPGYLICPFSVPYFTSCPLSVHWFCDWENNSITKKQCQYQYQTEAHDYKYWCKLQKRCFYSPRICISQCKQSLLGTFGIIFPW